MLCVSSTSPLSPIILIWNSLGGSSFICFSIDNLGKDKVGSELRNKLKDLADHLIDTIDIHSLNNSERIALLRILVSYTVPKLATEKPSINTEERLFQVEIIDRIEK